MSEFTSHVPAGPPGMIADAQAVGIREAEARTARRPFNVLMVSEHFRFAYRILRCFQAAGARVHVLGGRGSRGLRLSRFCASFRDRASGYSGDLRPFIDEVNAAVAEFDIDLIVCGEHFMMGPLIKMGPGLNAPCFPMLTIEQFDLLNNKWRFTELCQSLGILCPRSRLIEDSAELMRAAGSGDIALPFVVKPLDFDGARGFVPVLQPADLHKLESVVCYPVIVQDFIKGVDVAASVYCDRGTVKAFVAHYRKRGTYFTFTSPEIRAFAEKIVHATKAHGVLNFDMRIGDDGSIYWLECNPRFFFWIYMALLAGVPFVEFGLPNWPVTGAATLPTGANVRFLKGAAIELFRPWRLTRRDFRYLSYVLADPLPWVRETLGLETV